MPETYKSKLRISVSPVFRLGADESTDGIGYTDAHIVAQGTGQYAHEQADVDKGLPLGAGGDEGGGGAIRDTAHDGQQHILKTDFQQPGDEQVQQNGTGDDTEAEQGDVEGRSEELLQVHRKADGHQEQHRYEKAQVKIAAQLADGRHLCQDDGEGGDEQDAACTAEPFSEYHRGDAGGSPHGAKADGQQPGDFLDGPFLGGHQFLVVAIPQQLRGRPGVPRTLIPVPPVMEQYRILNQLSKVLPIVQVYDGAYRNLENLSTTFPIQLKKSILQYAVQGKLVPQDPTDEPASALLERIRAEKEQLIKSGKIKRDKHESVIFRRDNSYYEKVDGIERCIDDDLPFEIPESWEWCRLGTILQKLTDGTHSTPKYTARGIPFISVKDISSGKISFERTKFISKTEHELLASRCDPHRDDILLTKVGTTGIPVLVDTDRPFSIFVSVAQLRFSTELLDKFFLIYLLKSPLVQTQCRENTKGVGNKNWVMRDIANTLICIPPLAEQKRIQASLANVLKSI